MPEGLTRRDPVPADFPRTLSDADIDRTLRVMGSVIDGVSMKLSLLISTAVAIVIAAVAMSSSASGSPGARVVPSFRSPSGNIHCYYDRKAFAPPDGTKRLLTCGIRHADCAMRLQRRCLAGDWHGWGLGAEPHRRLILRRGSHRGSECDSPLIVEEAS